MTTNWHIFRKFPEKQFLQLIRSNRACKCIFDKLIELFPQVDENVPVSSLVQTLERDDESNRLSLLKRSIKIKQETQE